MEAQRIFKSREKGEGVTRREIANAVPSLTEQYVMMVINTLKDLGLVMRRKNPKRELKPRPHGAVYLFKIDLSLVPDVPSLLKELGYSDVLEGEPSKERRRRKRSLQVDLAHGENSRIFADFHPSNARSRS